MKPLTNTVTGYGIHPDTKDLVEIEYGWMRIQEPPYFFQVNTLDDNRYQACYKPRINLTELNILKFKWKFSTKKPEYD